jgi:hypothetical protein
MQFRRLGVAAVAAALTVTGLALSPAQASSEQRAKAPVSVRAVYSFDALTPRNKVKDLSPHHRFMQLTGRFRLAPGADGTKHAVAFRARSTGSIAQSAALVPGKRIFAVAMVIKVNSMVGKDSPNVAQQGFFKDAGQWKVEVMPGSGHVRCRFKGTAGNSFVHSRRSVLDGKFHQIVCYRYHTKIGVQVDGGNHIRNVRTGSITSNRLIHVANKNMGSSVDQFRGVLDYFAIALGKRPIQRATQLAPSIP